MKELKTRSVLLDTQVYLQHRLRTDDRMLTRLCELADTGEILLFITPVIDGEVRKHIANRVSKAHESLSAFQKEADFLKSSLSIDDAAVFDKLDASFLNQRGIEIWEGFLSRAKVQQIPCDSVPASDLLARYFSSTAPFGPASKKAEFPDAISALAIENFVAKSGQDLYVISGDNDILRWSEKVSEVHHLNSLAQFLDIYSAQEEHQTEVVHALLERHRAFLESAIEAAFEQCGFVYSDNYEAEVENVKVSEVTTNGFQIIRAGGAGVPTEISVNTSVSFEASVSGPDFERGIWDKEDQMYAYLPDFEKELEITENYDVTFKLTYEEEVGDIDLTGFQFDGVTDIEVSDSADYYR